MKTDFLTLWVDDNIPFAQSIEANLKDWLDEKGFELKVSIHKDESGVLEEIKNKDIELIIIDYRLPGEDGDVLIEKIRQNDCYQDIIFYSEGQLPSKRLDGVFFVSKEDARTRIKELVELKLRRASDPASVRGWIVADAIELEEMVTNLLSQCFGEKDGFTISERLLHPKGRAFLDFGAKHQLLNGTLKDLISRLVSQDGSNEQKTGQLKNCKRIFEDFMNDVVYVRNAIAHQKVEDLETGKIIKTQKGSNIVLNEESFVQIRKNLRKHRDNLTTLQSLI